MSVRELAAGDIVESVDYDGFPIRLRVVRINDMTVLLKVMSIRTERCRELLRDLPKGTPATRFQLWSGPSVWVNAADAIDIPEADEITQTAA